GVEGDAKITQVSHRNRRRAAQADSGGLWARHPLWKVRQRPVWVANNQDRCVSVNLTLYDRQNHPDMRVEAIVDCRLAGMIPSNMSVSWTRPRTRTWWWPRSRWGLTPLESPSPRMGNAPMSRTPWGRRPPAPF